MTKKLPYGVRPDLLGQRFGRLLVVDNQPRTYDWMYLCRCDCGKTSVAASKNLRYGKSTSCGCRTLERSVATRKASRVDTLTYNSAHRRMVIDHGRASLQQCPCGKPADEWSYDNSDPNEMTDPTTGCSYSLDQSRYQALCRSCHRRRDIDHRRLTSETFRRGPNLTVASLHEITLTLTKDTP